MMNVKKYGIALTLQLLIAGYAIHAAPFIYVTAAQGYEANVVVVDAAINKIVAAISLPDANPHEDADALFIAVMPNNKYAYVADKDTQAVYVIDIATNTLLTGPGYPIMSGIGVKPKFSMVTPDSKYLYIATDGDEFSVIDTATNTAIPGSPFTVMPSIMKTGFMAINQDSSIVYFANNSGNQVIPVSIATNLSGTPISVGDPSTTQLGGIAITTDGNTLYVVDSVNNVVYPITNVQTIPMVGTAIPAGNSPVDIVLSPYDTEAYITNISMGKVSIIDTITNTPVLPRIPVESNPFFLVITPNGDYVYVGNFGSGTISAINTATKSSNVAGTPIDISAYGRPFSLAITFTAAPTNVIGIRKCNQFLDKTERILMITWSASTTPNVTAYNIYNGTTLVGTVPATSSLAFNAYIPKGDNGDNFSVSAVSSLGGESALVPVVIT